MKIHFWSVGKTHEPYVKQGVDVFTERVSRYYPVEWKSIPSPKNAAGLSAASLKKAEAETVLQILDKKDTLVLLDEKGRQFSSEKLATTIQQAANNSAKNLVFLIAGAFGADDSLLKRADITWSLSQLVFPHQLVRLILAEQVYRACTIIKNEKYHHS